jgi:putative Mg2+ transporter-C (MgtC) family protein
MRLGELVGQGGLQISELGLAFPLPALIGLEREIRHESAGLCTFVGFATALIMLVSKCGLGGVLRESIIFGPSPITAQIVAGMRLIGGGLILVRSDSVRGASRQRPSAWHAALASRCLHRSLLPRIS